MNQNRQLDSLSAPRLHLEGHVGGTLPRQTLGQSRQQDLAILRMLRVMRRQLWVIMLIAAFSLIASVVAVAMLKDRYKATTLLVMDQTEGLLLGSQDQTAPAPDSEVEIMQTVNMAQLVAERLQLDRDPEFVHESGGVGRILSAGLNWLLPSSFSRALSWGLDYLWRTRQTPSTLTDQVAAAVRTLQQVVTIRRRGLTDVIAIETISNDPQRAAEISNTYAAVSIEEQVAKNFRFLDRAEATLSRRIAELGQKLNSPEEGTQQAYQEALLRRATLQQQRSMIAPSMRIAAVATAPSVPFFPPRGLFVVLGTVSGFALGLGLAYFHETRAGLVRTEHELEGVAGVPTIGVIPTVPGSRRPYDQIVDQPLSDFSEAIRRTFLSLKFAVGNGRQTSVAVTSARSGQGKTTIALSLARAAAISGLKTVILDCDMRRPQLHLRLGLGNEFGLADALAGSPTSADKIKFQPDPKSTLRILSGGKIGNLPPERLLDTKRFEEFLETLKTKFEFIVLDVPPMQLYADPLILLHRADAVLAVTRAGQTTVSEIQTMLRRLQHAQNSCVVTVLNFAAVST